MSDIYLTDAKKKKILEEVAIYSNYVTVYKKEEWDSYITYLSSEKHLENTITSFNYYYFPKMVVQYFYCHVNNEGEVVRFNDCLAEDSYLKEHEFIYRRTNNDFIHYLIYNFELIYFVDFDNTLANNGKITKSKADFFKKYKYKDNVVICTTRLSFVLKDTLLESGLEDNYYVSLNGAVINKGNEIVKIHYLGNDSENILRDANSINLDYFSIYKDIVGKGRYTEEQTKALNALYPEIPIDNNKTDYNELIGIAFYIKVDDEHRFEKEEMVNEIARKYEGTYSVRTSEYIYEILNKKANKGNAVREVSEMMGKYYRASVGFGDSITDFPMLSLTGHSYVVSNATESLKSKKFEQLDDETSKDIVKVIQKYESIAETLSRRNY